MTTSTSPETGTGHGKPRAALAALGWSAAVTAAVVALGYASYRWAATVNPLQPLPGSPWPYLATWGAFCLACCLLLRWSTGFGGIDGAAQAIGAMAFAGIRTSLAHRPELALLWTYGALALALAAVAAVFWRLRHRSP
ncbi:hypothetical protein [Streptomyces sp. NBC_00347]|uniref:hypothetical protein n=1 Tax=Streptomyces sp. NBC_00347 TaxID=2975721 RepID=UPI00225C2078|nr:hypothetical protein [Streptomyces sp. NBC_00347]MCX5123842.1 hypothetical protein [Streptomyces sp. NBC_00347]